MTDAELDEYIEAYVADLRANPPPRKKQDPTKRPLTVVEKYMGRQLTMSAVLGNDAGAKKVILYDVRYKMAKICQETTTTQTECFADLGDYKRGLRICFMATLAQWRDPKTGETFRRLTRFKRVYVVP